MSDTAAMSPPPPVVEAMDTTETSTVAAASPPANAQTPTRLAGEGAEPAVESPSEQMRSTSPVVARPAEPTAEELEAQATKKRKLAVVADESKKRGRRMFGLLQSTLKQAKTATDPSQLSGAAAKRKELEDRLAKKLQGEKAELEAKQNREREQKELRLNVVKKEEEIGRAQAIYDTRHATKLHLAHFLCTSFTLPPPQRASDDISVPYAPRLPHAQRVVGPSRSKPIYYLPYKLTIRQEDQIEDQIAAVKKQIRVERDKWDDHKGAKVDGLQEARRKRDERMGDIERAEREERQRRRREEEQREERRRSDRPAENGDKSDRRDNDEDMRSVRDSESPTGERAPRDDAEMDGKNDTSASAQAEKDAAGPAIAVKGTAGRDNVTEANVVEEGVEETRMDVGDDVEY